MSKSGKPMRLLLLCFVLLPGVSLAALESSVDRYRVSMGDTLQLTLASDGDVNPSDADLSAVEQDFDILQRSSSNSTSIVNGQSSRRVELNLEITPKREGDLNIPAIDVNGERTSPIAIQVDPAPTMDSDEATVLFSAEVDNDTVYVQQQVLLTLRVQQAVNLDDRSVTELQLDNAFIKPLGQNSFQRTQAGRRWLVHEIRYAIFPEESGTLEIPAQMFAARVRQNSRSLFDLSSGPRLRRESEPVLITVNPRPADFPGQTWLPAADLTLEESWSSSPDALETGESVTRTITLSGTGLQGAQLPPVYFPAVDGLKYYPDQPRIEDAEAASGMVGVRTDSAALVPVKPGTYAIPEIRIPWWDTNADKLRWAVLPGREVTVSPGPAANRLPGEVNSITAVSPAVASSTGSNTLWQTATLVCAAGWLITTALWWRRSRREQTPKAVLNEPSPREKTAWKQLQAALASGDPGASRHQLVIWLGSLPGVEAPVSPAVFAADHGNTALLAAIDELDASLYGKRDSEWHPDSLLAAVKVLRKTALGELAASSASASEALPPLYPASR